MKRTIAFAKRNFLELIRDPLSIIFNIGLPAVLLVLMATIDANIDDVSIFPIQSFAPGIIVFGGSFLTMFCSILVCKDRTSAFAQRLHASPLRPVEYIFGYALPLLPICMIQTVLCFVIAALFGLKITLTIIPAFFVALLCSLPFIFTGLILGNVLTEKSVGGVSSIIVQCTALLSGMWFSPELVGGIFADICGVLPFANMYNAVSLSVSGGNILTSILFVIGYAVILGAVAIVMTGSSLKE